MRIITRRAVGGLLCGGAIGAIGACSTTSSPLPEGLDAQYFARTPALFPQFAVAPEYPAHGYDFTALTEMLRFYVVDFGESDRVAMPRPAPPTGSRFPVGHQSPYRNEANRIPFSLIEDRDVQRISETKRLIEALPEKAPLEKAAWLDQMAFWFNLHNVALIEQIAKSYPMKTPSSVAIGGVPLNDAKLVAVNGTPLSLRDIRVEIVYRNWRHPAAIYGFFRGDVGGPSIQRYAFDGSALSRQLGRVGAQFVNSLRGVRDYGDYTAVSKLYDELALILPDFYNDLRTHLLSLAQDEVRDILSKSLPLRLVQYDRTIADLRGGAASRSSVSTAPSVALSDWVGVDSFLGRYGASGLGLNGLSQSIVNSINDLRRKNRRLQQRQGFPRRRGAVTIDDLPTSPVR